MHAHGHNGDRRLLAALRHRDVAFAQIVDEHGRVLSSSANIGAARMALAVADRAYVMETGRITLEGPAAVLRRNPQVEQSYLGA